MTAKYFTGRAAKSFVVSKKFGNFDLLLFPCFRAEDDGPIAQLVRASDS